MKCILLFIVCICVIGGSRITRQTDGSFWWENIANGGTNPSNDVTNDQTEDVSETGEEEGVAPKQSSGSNVAGNEEVTADILPPSEKCDKTKNRVCVPYNLCRNGKIITDGFGLLTTRSGVNLNQHSECPLYLEVCCEEPDLDTQVEDDKQNDGNEQKHAPECGQRNYEGVGATVNRINSSFSQFAEFPWMAAVLKKESIAGKDFKLYMCGASLLSSRVILTASHCIITHKAKNIIVRLGEWDTQQTYEPFPYQERSASTLIHHPDYNPNSLAYDFSLIVVDIPFTYEPHIAPICLPTRNDVFDGQMCYATGWGKEQFGVKGTYQNVLKNVDLEMISHSNCETALKVTRLGIYFELHNTFVCAGGKTGKDTCGGDGGSPLVCSKKMLGKTRYYQTGIVAWGIGCGEKNVPGVYADVRKAVDWIQTEMTPYLTNLDI